VFVGGVRLGVWSVVLVVCVCVGGVVLGLNSGYPLTRLVSPVHHWVCFVSLG